MKKTIDINLGGMRFHLDDDAYERVHAYLHALSKQLEGTEGRDEILQDIESRLAELFHESLTPSKQVVTLREVESAMATLGQPEDFGDGQPPASETQHESSGSGETYRSVAKRLYRETEDYHIGGVCGGLGAYFRVDPAIFRVLFLLLFFVGGTGIMAYLILWIALPAATTTAEKLAMRGEEVTVENIKKAVEQEAHRVKDRFQAGIREVSPRAQRAGHRIGDAFTQIFEGILRVVGVLLRIVGFFLLVALSAVGIALLVVATNKLSWGADWTQDNEFYIMMLTVLPSGMSMTVVWIATIASIAGILLELGALILRFTFRVHFARSTWRGIHGVAILSSLVGVLIWVIMGVQMGLEFREEARHIEAIALAEDRQEWVLDVALSERTTSDQQVSLGEFMDGLEFYYDGIQVDVKQSMRQSASLECLSEAWGPNRRAARNNANNVRYSVNFDGDTVRIEDLIHFPLDDRFRGQNVRFTLYLPVGHKVYITGACSDYLDQVDNLENMYDSRMAGKLWMMTEEGLTLYAESSL
jgi:phage shock protein PspC (stress-responsive transcriptional regulator)